MDEPPTNEPIMPSQRDKPTPVELSSPADCSESECYKVWQCPYCKWLVSNDEYLSIIFDAPCPRCKTLFSRFNSKMIGTKIPNTKAEG